MIEIIENGIKYKLGKNAVENFMLIDEAEYNNDNYWWFHIDDHPSGHCIIETESIDKNMVLFAGDLVKKNSKLKNHKKIKIIYTQIKNIKKTKTMGQVILLDKPMSITL